MKKFQAIALSTFGLFVLCGLGFILYKAFPQIVSKDSTVLLAITALIVAVAAALFVLGVFLGYFYGRPVPAWRLGGDLQKRFHNALDFERRERSRLERGLEEAQRSVVGLKDNLKKKEAEAREREASARHHEAEILDKEAAICDQEVSESQVAKRDAEIDRLEEERLAYQSEAVKAAEEALRTRQEVEDLSSRHDRLRHDLTRRKERIADLMAELSIAQTDAEYARDEVDKIKSSFETNLPVSNLLPDASSVKDVLAGIAKLEGIKVALVADDHGLVVEAAGDGLSSDILAAISALVTSIGPGIREILPIGEVSNIRIGDDQGLVIETCYFDLFDARCALALAREEDHPYPRLAEKAVESIVDHFCK
jgi:hypothetical protein